VHVPAASSLADEARRIVIAGERVGVTLRVLGGAAVEILAKGGLSVLGRAPVRDIDLAGLSDDRPRFYALFADLGYERDEAMDIATEGRRFAFASVARKIEVDVFVDRLEMAHVVDWRERLHVTSPTLSPADVLLAKLQIHDLDRKDAADVIALLLTLPLDEQPGSISPNRLTAVLADDWGFWFSARATLSQVTSALENAGLAEAQRAHVRTQLQTLNQLLDSAPKTGRWRRRALIGTRKRWYDDVSDDVAVY
jgi:hypothetical protein